jgi:hypothetical protein
MRKKLLISDQSGAEIPDGTGAVVTIKFRDKRKGGRVLDLTDAEAERLGGRHAKRRRPPNAASSSQTAPE